jgi:hypothetical protein
MSLPLCEKCGKKQATGAIDDEWMCPDCLPEWVLKLLQPFGDPGPGGLFTPEDAG